MANEINNINAADTIQQNGHNEDMEIRRKNT